MLKQKYDIFISYRRDGGFETAKLICDCLKNRGYRVFLDVEALRSGKFNTQLFNFIDMASDFILIVSKNALDRCHNDGDWVKEEICYAMKQKKNIIPVILAGASFPNPMPKDIEGLELYNGVSSSHEYFDAAIDNLCKKLQAKKQKKWLKIIVPLFAVLLMMIIILLFLLVNKSEETETQAAQVSVASQSIEVQAESVKVIVKDESEKHPAVVESVNKQNDTMFVQIVKSGNVGRAKSMLKNGANPNAMDENGISVLTCALGKGQKDLVLLLLEKGAVADGVDARQMHDMRVAMSLKWPDVFVKMLEKNKEVPSDVILSAAMNKDSSYLKFLYHAGVNLNVYNGDDACNNPFSFALCSNNPENIRILHQAGVDAGRKNNMGLSPIELLIMNFVPNVMYRNSGFYYYGYQRNGIDQSLKEFILHYPDMINAVYKGNTLLHIDISLQTFEYLLGLNKINVNSINDSGKTPLHIHAGKYEFVELLLKYGADKNIKDKDGATPAVYAKEKKTIELLSSGNNSTDVWNGVIESKDYSTALDLLDTYFTPQLLSKFFENCKADNNSEYQKFLLALLKKYKYPIAWGDIKNASDNLKYLLSQRNRISAELLKELHKSGIAVIPEVWLEICRRNPDATALLHGVEYGASLDVKINTGYYGNKSLADWAILKNELTLFRKLLERGVVISEKQIDRMAEKEDFLRELQNRGMATEVPLKKLINKNVKIEFLRKALSGRNLSEEKIISYAVGTGRHDVVELLFEHGAKIDNEYILCGAIKNNDIKMIEVLLANGANPGVYDELAGGTVFDLAADKPQIAALFVDWLYGKKDVALRRAITEYEEVVLQRMLSCKKKKLTVQMFLNMLDLSKLKYNFDYVAAALHNGYDADVLKMLLDRGVKVNNNIISTEYKHISPEILDLLMKNGLQLSISDLDYIMKREDADEIIKVAFANGFKIDEKKNSLVLRNIDDCKLLKVLLDNGVKVTRADVYNAKRRNASPEIIKLLQEKAGR